MCSASYYVKKWRTNILAFKMIRVLLDESSLAPGMESAHKQRIGVWILLVNHTFKENPSLLEVDFHTLTNWKYFGCLHKGECRHLCRSRWWRLHLVTVLCLFRGRSVINCHSPGIEIGWQVGFPQALLMQCREGKGVPWDWPKLGSCRASVGQAIPCAFKSWRIRSL